MRKSFFLVIVLVSNIASAMQTDFVGLEELLATAPAMSEALAQRVTAWCGEHPDLCAYPATLKISTETRGYLERENKSCSNIVVPFTEEGGVVKLAGPSNILREAISTEGQDPWSHGAIEELGGQAAILERAKTYRRFQAVSALAYHRLLRQLTDSPLRSPDTFVYHISGRPTELDDRNYLLVQEGLSTTVVPFGKLSELERTEVVGNMNLEELYAVLKKVGLWNLHAQNLGVDTAKKQFWVSDLEKPNNEGYGKQSKWQVAVFGKGEVSDDPWQWRHNIRTGHGEFANILAGNPEKLELWKALLVSDAEVRD